MNGQQAQAIEQEADNIPLQIGFKRLSENAVIPTKAHVSDSGYDLFAAEDVVIAPGETVVVPTDIAIQLPEGYEAQVRPRSGVTSKTKLRIQLGTIDNAYRGNIGIIVDNITQKTYEKIDLNAPYVEASVNDFVDLVDGTSAPASKIDSDIAWKAWDSPEGTIFIRKHDKIAQLVVQQLPQTVAVEITDELDDTSRGANGFGSSGV